MARKPRDYKAEYARRVRGTKKGSPERQRARGNRPAFAAGMGESAYRNQRSRLKYGVSENIHRKLRAAAEYHILYELARVKTASSAKVETVRRGLKLLHAQTLREILNLTGHDLKYDASVQPDPDGDIDGPLRELATRMDYQITAQEVTDENRQFRNPFWYH